jgi:hypothetical protein
MVEPMLPVPAMPMCIPSSLPQTRGYFIRSLILSSAATAQS